MKPVSFVVFSIVKHKPGRTFSKTYVTLYNPRAIIQLELEFKPQLADNGVKPTRL